MAAETEGDVQYEYVQLEPDEIAKIKAMTTLQVAKMCATVFHPAWQKEENHFTRCMRDALDVDRDAERKL